MLRVESIIPLVGISMLSMFFRFDNEQGSSLLLLRHSLMPLSEAYLLLQVVLIKF